MFEINFKKNFSFKNLVLNSDLLINSFSLMFIYTFNFLIGLITLPYLIKIYGIENWGNIAFLQIFLNYLIWLVDWSFNQYSLKFISINRENQQNKNKIFQDTISAQFLLAIFCIAITLITFSIWNQYEYVLYGFILIIIGNLLQSYWFLNGLEKIYETALLQFFNKLIFSILILNKLNSNSGIFQYFLYYGICYFLTGLICQLIIKFKYKIKIYKIDFHEGINLLKKSSNLFKASIYGSLVNSTIPLFIKTIIGINALGIYNIADRIKGMSVQITTPISHSFFPKMNNEYIKNKEVGNNYLKIILYLFFFITFIAFIAINIFIKEIVTYFTSENILLTVIILRILLFSFLINVIEEVMVNQYLIPNGLYSSVGKLKSLILFTILFIGFPLIYFHGLIGAACTNLIAEITGLLFIVFKYKTTKNKKISLQKF